MTGLHIFTTFVGKEDLQILPYRLSVMQEYCFLKINLLKMKKYLILIFLLILFSCSQMTKESYMEDYKLFLSEVKSKSFRYTKADWDSSDKKFQKFSTEWYNRFKSEFTWKDHIVLSKYEFQYNLYKYGGDIKETANQLFGNYSQLKNKIQFYLENDMLDDAEFLIKQANEIGGDAEKLMDKVLNDIDFRSRK